MLLVKRRYTKPPRCGFMIPCRDAQVAADKEACGASAAVTLRDPEANCTLHVCQKHLDGLEERGLYNWSFTPDGNMIVPE